MQWPRMSYPPMSQSASNDHLWHLQRDGHSCDVFLTHLESALSAFVSYVKECCHRVRKSWWQCELAYNNYIQALCHVLNGLQSALSQSVSWSRVHCFGPCWNQEPANSRLLNTNPFAKCCGSCTYTIPPRKETTFTELHRARDLDLTRQKGKLQGRKLRVFLTRLASYRSRLSRISWATILEKSFDYLESLPSNLMSNHLRARIPGNC